MKQFFKIINISRVIIELIQTCIYLLTYLFILYLLSVLYHMGTRGSLLTVYKNDLSYKVNIFRARKGQC